MAGRVRVSIVCPVFNTAPQLLAAAVRSVLEQEGGTPHELLLVDDASSASDTLTALEQASRNPQITVVRAAYNGGPARARNLGVARATGDWIAFIDSDDIWPLGKLARAEAILRQHSDTVWIGAAEAKLEADGQLRPGRPMSCLSTEVRAADGSVLLSAPALTRSFILEGMHLGANLLRRDLLLAAGGFDARITYGEDWVLLSRISLAAPMRYDPEIGYVLRRQQASMMWSGGRLSSRFASGQQIAFHDPMLKPFRREIRWELYKTYKDIAANNLLNRRRLRALWFAARAFAVDPREVADLLLLIRLLPAQGGPALATALQRYSSAEQIDLARIGGMNR